MLWIIAKYDKVSLARLAANQEVPREFFEQLAEAASLILNITGMDTPTDAECQDMLRVLLKDYPSTKLVLKF
jgi:hypothetical protein